jgi:hypothetical protein
VFAVSSWELDAESAQERPLVEFCAERPRACGGKNTASGIIPLLGLSVFTSSSFSQNFISERSERCHDLCLCLGLVDLSDRLSVRSCHRWNTSTVLFHLSLWKTCQARMFLSRFKIQTGPSQWAPDETVRLLYVLNMLVIACCETTLKPHKQISYHSQKTSAILSEFGSGP